ncbi:MAG: uracil-DNA glycosylase [Crocinitomicaceae bacterium]
MELKLNSHWKSILSEIVNSTDYAQLCDKVKQSIKQSEVLPEKENIFRVFNELEIDQIKVVILGQDPYPTPGHANGLCFSVNKQVQPLPKSLKNIFKEIESDLGIQKKHGDLSDWSDQGVFLLNTVLTVTAGEANSHKNYGWQKFTDAVIQEISNRTTGTVFLLWGNQAITKKTFINSEKHFVLESVHPSPLSAYRGFFGCKHFSKANELLISQGKVPINW